jgi:hypothetical protein
VVRGVLYITSLVGYKLKCNLFRPHLLQTCGSLKYLTAQRQYHVVLCDFRSNIQKTVGKFPGLLLSAFKRITAPASSLIPHFTSINAPRHQKNTSSHNTVYISCDIPLVVPIPLPYHAAGLFGTDPAPSDSLPRHHYPLKRKRVDDDDDVCDQRISRGRSALLAPWPSSSADSNSTSHTRTNRTRVRRSVGVCHPNSTSPTFKHGANRI